ncbi:acyl-CoA thioesterase [Mumia sp. zg.B53]|nr:MULTISPECIES: acyl-CoA thioesterase [unclassified Mumia]MBW9216254.1 acyl-CoA thioesterase [Mumia sp. zg.B53]MDD9350273.1 acyl-CoA thioesterase [Mumia sp.]
MHHVYSCPMRWADMDSQGHVNNVTYADYFREARLAAGEGARLVRLELEYRAPLVFRPEPVLVESSVFGSRTRGDTVLEQQIIDLREDGGRTVYARGRSVLVRTRGRLPAVAPSSGPATDVPVLVRARDLGPDGAVDEAATLELFQEGRVAFVSSIGARDPELPWVIGRSELTYLRPIVHRERPYAVRTAVTRVGRSSFEIRAEMVDDEPAEVDGPVVLVTSRAVIVGFDPGEQRSRPLTEHERSHLLPHLARA